MHKGMGVGMASEILITSLARSGEDTISTCRSMPSHMVRQQTDTWSHGKKKKNLKNIYIYFSSSISQEVSEEWMVGERWNTEGKGRKGGRREGRRYQQARICNCCPQLSSEAAVPTCPRQHFQEIGMHTSHDLNILRKPRMVLVRAEFPSKVLASLLYVTQKHRGE